MSRTAAPAGEVIRATVLGNRGSGRLWAFNEEVVARAIYRSQIPVISAVGHEPDVTIADFVADLRAATPSNAAELAVPDQNEIYGALLGDGGRLRGAITFRLDRYRQALDRLATSRPMREPASYWKDKRLLLDYQSRQLCHGFERCLAGRREELARLSAALDAMSPLRVLARGYAVARGEGGQVVSSVEQVRTGERLELTLSDGTLDCQVL